VVFVNSELTDSLGVVVLPSIPLPTRALGALDVCFRVLPEPCRARVNFQGQTDLRLKQPLTGAWAGRPGTADW
jgi:hypothetical protein